MGAWSDKPFGNDVALDWVGELEKSPPSGWRDIFLRALDDFGFFEESRRRGENFVVRTPEMAQAMIAMFQVPVAPIIEKTILDGVGKRHEYPGDDETFVLVAAAELIRLRLVGESVATIAIDLAIPLDAVPVDLAPEFVMALGSIHLNKTLVRDHGRAWLREVMALSAALDGAAETESRGR